MIGVIAFVSAIVSGRVAVRLRQLKNRDGRYDASKSIYVPVGGGDLGMMLDDVPLNLADVPL